LKLVVRLVLALLAALLVLTLALPFSEVGTQKLLGLAERFTPLKIEYRGGSLASRLQLSRLVYQADDVRVELVEVAARLDSDCLWRSALCFRELGVGQLFIDLEEGGEQATDTGSRGSGGGPGTTLVFPVAIESDELRVESTAIRWSGGEWRQGPARIEFRLNGSEITLEQASVSGPLLVLQADQTENAPVGSRIELPAMRLPFKLSVQSLLLAAPRWDVNGNLYEQDELMLAGVWRGKQLRLDRLEAVVGELGSLSAEGRIEFDGDWPLQVSALVEVAEERTVAVFPGGPVAVELSGTPSALTARLATEGARTVSLDLKSDLLDPLLPFEMELVVAGASPLAVSELTEVPGALDGMVLELPWRVGAAGNLERQRFELRGAMAGLGYRSVGVTARGERAGESVELEQLSLRDEAGDNQLEIEGRLRLSEIVELSLAVRTPGLALPELLTSLQGRLQGGLQADVSFGDGRWQLALAGIDLGGDINGHAAHASGVLFLDQDWHLGESDLDVVASGAELRLLGGAGGAREGRLSMRVDDLGRWQPAASGRLAVSGTVDPGARKLDWEGELHDLTWQALSTDRVRFDGSYSLEGGAFAASVSAGSLVVAELDLTATALSVSGDEQRQTVRLASEGDIRGALELAGSGWGDQWRGSLAPVRLETPAGVWQTDQDVPMQWNREETHLAIGPHCWKEASASICASALRLGSVGSVELSAEGDMANLGLLLPADMEVSGTTRLFLAGNWDDAGEVLFEGSSETRTVQVTRHYGEDESARVSWDSGEGRFRFDGEEVSLQWSLQRQGSRIFDLDLLSSVAADGPVGGRVTVSELELEPLVAFVPALSELKGQLSGELALTGTRDSPQVSGRLRLADGVAALAGNPTRLESTQLTLVFRGEQGEIQGSGILGGGSVRVAGNVSLQPWWSLRLQVEGERQTVLYPPATEMLLSQRLTVAAAPGSLDVSGEITVHEGKLELEQLPEGSVAVSPHVVEVDYRGNVVRQELPFDLSLDLRIEVENRFRITTSLLFATLGGELSLVQPRGQPLQLFGTLRVVDGYVTAYQQKLQIQRGIFSFTGQPDNPAMNVRAVRNISGSNIVVGLQVQGTYEALSMEVFSEPAMSDSEAMSYLLRGRGIDASAGQDGTTLALSLVTGVVNRSTLVTELNRIPGVSKVSFGAEGTEDDAAATVSGFIGERIYLSYGIGVYEPINVLIARLYLRTRLWIEVVSRLENSVDLYYAFDID
jgi:autotransporter translocation and assembly factor TamB